MYWVLKRWIRLDEEDEEKVRHSHSLVHLLSFFVPLVTPSFIIGTGLESAMLMLRM
ncbi:hypothetical protein BT69DRAFT_1283560 [Atractiella rhizophila]|nr:hypothetical protein BT69DRAFT_1283560 [Atractiella rhizophila]